MREVRKERTNWRDNILSEKHKEWGYIMPTHDADISERHRTFGWHLPALDLDFILIEYNQGIPYALIEYKHEQAQQQRVNNNKSLKALQKLGDMAGLPVFGVRYAGDYSWYKVTGLNKLGRDIIPEMQTLCEDEYKQFLHGIINNRT